MMDNRGLKDAHSNTCKTVAAIDAGLNAINTTVNEAKVPRENLKVDKVKRNVRTRGQSLMYAKTVVQNRLSLLSCTMETESSSSLKQNV